MKFTLTVEADSFEELARITGYSPNQEELPLQVNEPVVQIPPQPDPVVTSVPTPEQPSVLAQKIAEAQGKPADPAEVDSTGMPWDARIHASTKTKVDNDTKWKKRRGVDDALVEQVEAELLGTEAPATNAPVTSVPVPDTAPIVNTPVPDAPTAAAPAMDFNAFMATVSANVTAGVITPADLQTACGVLGLGAITDMKENPAKIAEAQLYFQSLGKMS